jgi:hypothetical protein
VSWRCKSTSKKNSGYKTTEIVEGESIKEFRCPVSNTSDSLIYRVIPSVLDPRKCEYLKDYSLDFD